MLNFFKKISRKKLDMQIDLIRKICQLLPDKFNNLLNQVNNGIIKDIRILDKPFPNYHKFVLDVNLLNRYEDKSERCFLIKGIFVSDKSLQSLIEIRLIIAYGILIGYSIPFVKDLNPDLDGIFLKSMSLEYFGENVFNKIKPLLTNEELKLINPSDVYEIELNNRTYYHIKELQDGDFIGIDLNKNLFKITHDPFEIKKVDEIFLEVLKTFME